MTKLRTSLVNLHERPKIKVKAKIKEKSTTNEQIISSSPNEEVTINFINPTEPEKSKNANITKTTRHKSFGPNFSKLLPSASLNLKSFNLISPSINLVCLILFLTLSTSIIYFITLQQDTTKTIMHLKHKIKSLDEYNAKLEGLIRVFEENGVIQRTNSNNNDDKFETMQIFYEK